MKIQNQQAQREQFPRDFGQPKRLNRAHKAFLAAEMRNSFAGRAHSPRAQARAQQQIFKMMEGFFQQVMERVMSFVEKLLGQLLGGAEGGQTPDVQPQPQPDAGTPAPDSDCSMPVDCAPVEEPPVQEPAPKKPECEEAPVTPTPEPTKPECEVKPECDVKTPVTPEPKVETPVAPEPDAAAVTKDDFKSYVAELLKKSRGETVHEERFQYGIAAYLIKQKKGEEAANAFTKAWKSLRVKGANAGENATKAALKKLVKDGVLSRAEATQINGLSFKAAQLDGNEEMLYDGKGSTSAKMGFNRAINTAWKDLDAALNADADWGSRSLNAPSTPTQESKESGRSHAAANGVGSGEFLWKPRGDHSNKLVILMPSRYTGLIQSVSIFSRGREIDSARPHGEPANGNREHFRFDKAGGRYPDGSVVVAKLIDGTEVKFKIGESSSRNTQ